MLLLTLASRAAPTVNGLFFGDGDQQRYSLFNTSVGGSGLYYAMSGSTLYVALVVGRDVNDNVFGDRTYTQNAGWHPAHTARRLTDSEFAEFSLTVGAQSWTWRQGYGAQPDGTRNNTQATWFSSHLAGDGSGTPPPGYVSSSSFVWNLNTYAMNAAHTWDMNVNGASADDWKSPFLAGSPSVVLGLDGYPASGAIGYNAYYQWEWPMVYEWSVDLSSFGPSPIFVMTGSSHHSPAKNDLENDLFPPAPDGGEAEPLMDFGDLPTGFQTRLSDNGARHLIVPNGAFLGAAVDPDPDGFPTTDADGDDVSALADEDGVQFLTPFKTGETAEILVTAGKAGYLSAFLDFQNDGVLSVGTLVSATGPAALTPGALLDLYVPVAGAYTLTVAVQEPVSPVPAARFRFTNEAGEGGASPYGLAQSGEVEDYVVYNATLSSSVDVRAYALREGVVIDLCTIDEAGQGDIVVYAWIGAEWLEVGRVPAEEVLGDGSNRYRIRAAGLEEGQSYRFKVIDEVGGVHHTAAPVRVKAIKTRSVRLVSDQLELTFDTEPGHRYVVRSCSRLGASSDEWADEFASQSQPNGWSAFSAAPFKARGAQSVVLVRKPVGQSHAYYKVVLAD